jgi:hypothetical protein
MSKIIVYSDESQNVIIVVPANNSDIESIIKNDIPENNQPVIMDSDNLPNDYSTRAAWILVDNKVIIDETLLAKIKQTQEQEKASRQDALSHAKTLGFTDAMIAVMYPNLVKS